MLRPLALLFALSLGSVASAQAPREIPYQGTLADGGAPVTAATPVVFRLHDALTGGSIVWAESQTVTPDADGRFTARLGSVADLPGSFDQPLWLSVTAGGTALGPRTPLGAAPVALALYGIRVIPPTTANEAPSIVAGHPENLAGEGAVVAGGGRFTAGVQDFRNQASGTLATVSGGAGNTAAGLAATIGGGGPHSASQDYATVGGGDSNTASGYGSTVGGGSRITASGSVSTVGGGSRNTASGSSSTVGGGTNNTASGSFSTIPGGRDNTASGKDSFAAGRGADAATDGSFVWSGTTSTFASTADEQFLVDAPGGVGIGTNAPTAQLHVETDDRRAGVFLNDSEAFAGVTVYAENASTGNGIAGWFETNGTDAALVAYQRGTGDLIRGIKNNNLKFSVKENGDVTADGTFTGGGADLAEFFPLADGATVTPGQVVGLTAGRVSLATDGAEQIAVISSNPAFVGNPDAQAGGALVALVGQVAVDVTGDAAPGDLLVASGAADGRAVAVSPEDYTPADGAVLGRVLTADGGAVIALVGVDEAAALRGVVARQAEQIEALRADRDGQRAELDALTTRLEAMEARLAPRATR